MTETAFQSGDLTVVCHVRAPLLHDTVDSRIETLQTAASEGIVDSLLLRSWPDRVALTAASPNQEVVETFERFERWADAADVSIRPPFRVRTSTMLASDTPKRILVTPVCTLALYRDERLAGVYPHATEDTTHTVADAVEAIATAGATELPGAGVTPPEASPSDGSPADSDAGWGVTRNDSGVPATCPVCEQPLVNVHGILACNGCRWTDAELDAVQSAEAKLVYLSLRSRDDPVTVETLQTILGLTKLSLYGILQTLSQRGLVTQTDAGAYRASDAGWDERSRPAPRGE